MKGHAGDSVSADVESTQALLAQASNREDADKCPSGPRVSSNRIREENKPYLKWLSLLALTLQSVIATAMLRYSRSRQADPSKRFLTSTTVAMGELYKLILSFGFLYISEGYSWAKYKGTFHYVLIENPWDTAKTCIPAVLYLVQNNLLWAAANYLDPAAYLVVYQVKILTAALFTVILLHRNISKTRWFALLILVGGVASLEVGLHGDAHDNISAKKTADSKNPLLGSGMLLSACLISGFAGVYFELVLKTSSVSVWMRNIQMGSVSFVAGVVSVYVYDTEVAVHKGFFHGYDAVAWLTIVAYSSGGLIVACVIKYADNILKGFATSVSIIISAVTDVILFGSVLPLLSQFGAGLVIVSVMLYSWAHSF